MSWADIVSEGYGFGASGGISRFNNEGEQRKSNGRICLSISDLSRIFPSTSDALDDEDNGPTPMMCYKYNAGSRSSVYSDGGDKVKRRVSSVL